MMATMRLFCERVVNLDNIKFARPALGRAYVGDILQEVEGSELHFVDGSTQWVDVKITDLLGEDAPND